MIEYINMNNKHYGYAIGFRDNDQIRSSFNSLVRKTYGFDFEEWYQNGYWKDKYIPYALLDGEKVISNVSVNVIDFLVMGEKKRCIQLGTVMTDHEYRKQGLSRFLIERIIDEWSTQSDLIYLFANDSVLNFYPKFGFVVCDEYQYFKDISVKNITNNIKKLDMSNAKDREFLSNTISRSIPFSKLSMLDNESLIMFYCTSFMKENIYYIKELDVIVIAEYDREIFYLNDVFSIHNVPLKDIIQEMVNKDIKKIVFGFTPEETTLYDVNPLYEKDTTLFILKNKADLMSNKKLMFPLLSHA